MKKSGAGVKGKHVDGSVAMDVYDVVDLTIFAKVSIYRSSL